MGISSSIGSNTFDILLCLGLPWFIKSYFDPTVPGHYYVSIESVQIEIQMKKQNLTKTPEYMNTFDSAYVRKIHANNFSTENSISTVCLKS